MYYQFNLENFDCTLSKTLYISEQRIPYSQGEYTNNRLRAGLIEAGILRRSIPNPPPIQLSSPQPTGATDNSVGSGGLLVIGHPHVHLYTPFMDRVTV